jgi:hypothetical protein
MEHTTMEGLRPGRIVYYVVSEGAVAAIEHDRAIPPRTHANPVAVGDVYPAMVIGLIGWEDPAAHVNLKVFLDGDDTYWALSVPYSETHRAGTWHWPG